MPNFIFKALNKLYHLKPKRPQYAPYRWNRPFYGKHTQYAPLPDDSERTDANGIKWVQSVAGTFLCYGRAVDQTIPPAINDIWSTQSKPTEETNKHIKMFLDYMWTYSNAKIQYNASDMILNVDFDADYLVLPNARSRVAGYYYMSHDFRPK